MHDLPVRSLIQTLNRVSWRWLAPAVVLDLTVYVCAAWEWQILLRPTARLSFAQTLQAMFAGRFANDALPFHAGYILRLYLASLWANKSIPLIIPSLLLERFLDAAWLVMSIAVTLLFFPLPATVLHTLEVLVGVIFLGAAIVFWIVRREQQHPPTRSPFWSKWKPIRKSRHFLQQLAFGFRRLSNPYLVLAALGLSAFKLTLQGALFLLLLWSYGFAFSFWTNLALFLVAYVGMSLPSTPASMGVFQLFCVSGLRYFGVSKTAASGFALLSFVVLMVPLSVCGFIAFAQSGLTWRTLRTEVGKWKQTADES